MKKIFYTSYAYWRKIEKDREKYMFFSISYTVPQYFSGIKYTRLVPSEKLHENTRKNGYDPQKYYREYFREISKSGRKNIEEELKSLSGEKQPVLLGWEQDGIYGECQFVIQWIYNLKKDEAREFELSRNMEENREQGIFQE